MPVPTQLSDLNATAASNSPAATDTISTTDDYLRAHASILARISAGTDALVSPTITTANATTVDTTNLEVTNVKAKDGTASATIADSTGVVNFSAIPTITSNGSVVGTSATQTLTNKTVNLSSNTLTGTLAQFNSAVSDADLVSIAGTETLTNKALTSPTVSGGTIDNAVIGGATPAAGTFTTLTSTGNATLGDNPAADTHTINGGLTVKNTGSGNSLLIEDSASTDATPFVIDASGNLIRGFTAAQEVRISTTAITPPLQNLGASGTLGSMVLGVASITDSTAAYQYFTKWASGTIGDNTTAVASGEILGTLTWSGSDGAAQTQAATIRAEVDGTPGTNDMPGRLIFSTTADGSSSPIERMRIDSAGNTTFATGQIRVTTSKTPASASASGTAGEICWDANYIYVCVAANTWKRVAIATW